jgi:hypothetical protein
MITGTIVLFKSLARNTLIGLPERYKLPCKIKVRHTLNYDYSCCI